MVELQHRKHHADRIQEYRWTPDDNSVVSNEFFLVLITFNALLASKKLDFNANTLYCVH